MRKQRKAIWVLAASLLLGAGIGGVWLAGSPSVSAEVSKETKGRFVGLTDGNRAIKLEAAGAETVVPLAAEAWVYRNAQKAALADLKTGDQVELIVNNKSQAAYIKATAAAPSTQGDQGAGAGVGASEADRSAQAETQPKLEQVQAPVVVPGSEAGNQTAPGAGSLEGSGVVTQKPSAPDAAKQQQAVENGSWPWKRFSLEMQGSKGLIRAVQEPGGKSEFYAQMKDSTVVRLTGAEAERLLLQLLQGMPQAGPEEWERELKQRFGGKVNLKESSSGWKLDVEWKDDDKVGRMPTLKEAGLHNVVPQHERQKDRDYSHPKENGKGHDKFKSKDSKRDLDDDDDDDNEDDNEDDNDVDDDDD